MAKTHVSTTINGEPVEFLCEPPGVLGQTADRPDAKPGETWLAYLDRWLLVRQHRLWHYLLLVQNSTGRSPGIAPQGPAPLS